MRRRLTTTFILSLMLLGPLVPGVAVARTPQSASEPPPVGGDGAWRVTDQRQIEVDGQPFALSPDGAWLAGIADDRQQVCAWDVETLTPTCAAVDRPVIVGFGATAMTWAPDSSAFAFVEGRQMGRELGDAYVFDVATGELTNLTNTGGAADGPLFLGAAWTSDSQQVVLGVNHAGTRPDTVVRVDRSGGEPVAIALPDWDAEKYEIRFPPLVTADAVFVAIDSDADFGGVWRLSLDSANPEQMVASNGAPPIAFPVPASASRDGRYVNVVSWAGFQLAREGETYFLLDAESGALTSLVSRHTAQLISFAPSGDVGLVVRELDGEGRLHTLDLSTGEATPVANSPEAGSWLTAIPTWADNDTVFIPDDEGGSLVTLESAGGGSLVTVEPA